MLKIAYHPLYAHPLPEGHRFPMVKYELIPEQLMREGVITTENLFEPGEASDEIVLQTHEQEYLKGLRACTLDASHIRRIGFPLTPDLVKRELIIAQGTIECAQHARALGVSFNVAGGTHHAFAGRGEGFCLLNDFAIATNYLLGHAFAQRVLIIDLDVHQGNGTASLFSGNPNVFTFSMHGRHNYPFHKEKSDLDVELEDGTDDMLYITLLENNLVDIFHRFKPDFVFYLSGVDILATDKYGKLKISEAGCKSRDKLVFEYCKNYKVPVAVAMGGGYSPKISDIVQAHCNTFKAAAETFF